jgi:hypothetical protein
MTRAPIFALLLVSTLPAKAEDLKHGKEKFLHDFAYMLVAQERCSKWQINKPRVTQVLPFIKARNEDLEPGGRDWPILQKYAAESQKKFAGLDEDAACSMAELMYGPHGNVSSGFMIPTGAK